MEEETLEGTANFKLTPAHNNTGYVESIDYNIQGLLKDPIVVKGELVCTNYYSSHDGTSFQDLVLKEERQYIRDVDHNAIARVQTTTYYDVNNQVGHVKVTNKVYNAYTSFEEGNTRRNTTINQTKLAVMGLIGLMNGFDLMTSLSAEIMMYKEGHTQLLKDAITNSTKPYLTSEIKDIILDLITY